MNKAALIKATNTDEGKVPRYILQEICDLTFSSQKDCEKVAEYLIQRLHKLHINTKTKALNVIEHCCREGNPYFRQVLQHYAGFIESLVDSPEYNTDSRYNRIQSAAKDALGAIFLEKDNVHQNQQPLTSSSSFSYGYNPNQQQPTRVQQYGDLHSNEEQRWRNTTTNEVPSNRCSKVNRNERIGSNMEYNGNPSSTYAGNSNMNPHHDGPTLPVGNLNDRSNRYDSFGRVSWGDIKRSSGTMGVWGSQGSTNSPYEYQPRVQPESTNRICSESDRRPTVLIHHDAKSSWKDRMSLKFATTSSSSIGGGVLNKNIGSSSKLENLSKQVNYYTKKGMQEIQEAKEKWDRRGMDKSMAKSLAEHDDYTTGVQGLDRGYYQPQTRVETGGGDMSGTYERGLIDTLCIPGGLARTPPQESLDRFVELAQTLDADLIGEILFGKLMDSSWQVRLKGLCVIEALLEAPRCSHYGEWFEENPSMIQELAKEKKSSVRNKAIQVLEILGVDQKESTASVHPSNDKPPNGHHDVFSSEIQTSEENSSTPDPFGLFHSPKGTSRTRTLSDVGKDLFAQANAPSPVAGSLSQKSAFPFL